MRKQNSCYPKTTVWWFLLSRQSTNGIQMSLPEAGAECQARGCCLNGFHTWCSSGKCTQHYLKKYFLSLLTFWLLRILSCKARSWTNSAHLFTSFPCIQECVCGPQTNQAKDKLSFLLHLFKAHNSTQFLGKIHVMGKLRVMSENHNFVFQSLERGILL